MLKWLSRCILVLDALLGGARMNLGLEPISMPLRCTLNFRSLCFAMRTALFLAPKIFENFKTRRIGHVPRWNPESFKDKVVRISAIHEVGAPHSVSRLEL